MNRQRWAGASRCSRVRAWWSWGAWTIVEPVTRCGGEGELREQAEAIVGETDREGSVVKGGFLVETEASVVVEGGKPIELPSCEDSPAEIEALDVDLSQDGLSATRRATGPEATLDELGSFGPCSFE